MKTTATKEDYLRAILHLQKDLKEPVKAIDIARYLHLSKSTVSERLRELAQQKLITYEKYGTLKFTRAGQAYARKLTHKHRTIEVFLHTTLKIPKDEVHEEAHMLEHAFSDKVIKKLGTFLGNPKFDPHGSPIPALK